MNTKTPNQIFVALALAVADALECPECPEPLRDTLLEMVDPLSEHIAPAKPNAVSVVTLRGLVALAGSGDAEGMAKSRNARCGSPRRKGGGC
jgi:hypothetical protein